MHSLKLTHGLFSQASIRGYISPKCGSKPQRDGEMGSGKQMLQQARGRRGNSQDDCGVIAQRQFSLEREMR